MTNKPEDFMREAIAIIDQRGIDNGYDAGEERSAAKVADVYNALTGHQLTEAGVWKLLMVLKLVRNERKPNHDNIVDLIGYAGLLGETQSALAAEDTGTHKKVDVNVDREGIKFQAIVIDNIRYLLIHKPGAMCPYKLSLIALQEGTGLFLDEIGDLFKLPRDESVSGRALIKETDVTYRQRLIKRFDFIGQFTQ